MAQEFDFEKETNPSNNSQDRVRTLVALSLMSALAYVAMFVFRIKVAGFLTFDVKDAVITIAALGFGPVSGVIVALLVALIEMLTVSDTAFYGFVMNFISSAAFAATAGLFYRRRRDLVGAICGLICGVLSMTAVMLLFNLLITPLYFGMPRSAVIAMIPSLLLPFNLLKGFANAALTMLLYKPMMRVMVRSHILPTDDRRHPAMRRGVTVVVTAVNVLLFGAAIAVFLLVLNGKIFG